jgi:hypothetical protein
MVFFLSEHSNEIVLGPVMRSSLFHTRTLIAGGAAVMVLVLVSDEAWSRVVKTTRQGWHRAEGHYCKDRKDVTHTYSKSQSFQHNDIQLRSKRRND